MGLTKAHNRMLEGVVPVTSVKEYGAVGDGVPLVLACAGKIVVSSTGFVHLSAKLPAPITPPPVSMRRTIFRLLGCSG